MTAGGALAGLGGAQLVLASTLNWVENVTVGRGFVAVALVIFASWLPLTATLGALLFGAAVALAAPAAGARRRHLAFLLGMPPYVLTLVVLASPAAAGAAMPAEGSGRVRSGRRVARRASGMHAATPWEGSQ